MNSLQEPAAAQTSPFTSLHAHRIIEPTSCPRSRHTPCICSNRRVCSMPCT